MIIMDFDDVIKKRRSIRKFTDKPVSDELIEKILESARLAPTWANMQGVRIIVVRKPKNVQKIRDAVAQKWMKYCHSFIVVTIKPAKSGQCGDLKYFTVDAAIVMEHIILSAFNEGLGTCWIGHFKETEVQEALEIPKRSKVIAITPIGYSKYEPREQQRKSIHEITYRDSFKVKWT